MSEFDLRARCSAYFTYADLIECGETWTRLQSDGAPVANLPLRDETFEAIAALGRALLDPLRERFGAVEITYGFAGPSLTRHIPRRISPPHDQHAGCELGAGAKRICVRGGQACDLRVPGVDTLEVARWIRASLPFDRMYLYAADRPLHVSHAATPGGKVFAMRAGGRATVPCDVTRRGWDEIGALLAPSAQRIS